MENKWIGMNKEKLKEHLKNMSGIMIEYLKGAAIDSLIITVANLIFMFFMKMPFSILISIVVGITNIIPSVGPALGGLFGGVILFFKDPKMTLWFLIFTAVLQFIDGFVIKPKIFGKSFGMSGVVMLFVMILGGALFGVVGMVLCVPAVAIIKYIYKKIYLPRRQADTSPDTSPDKEEKESDSM